MAITLERTGPCTLARAGDTVTVGIPLRALDEATEIAAETVSASVNINHGGSVEGAEAVLDLKLAAQVDDFRSRSEKLSQASTRLPGIQTRVDAYLTTGNGA